MEEVPFDDRRVPRAEVDWERSLWWWYPLTRSIHPAMRLTSLLVAAITLLLSQVGIGLSHQLFEPRWSQGLVQLWQLSELQSVSTNALSVISDSSAVHSSGIGFWAGFIVNGQALLNYAAQGNVFSVFGLREVAYVSFMAIWLSTTLSIGGGILARRAVVELGQRTIAPWSSTVRLVASRWTGYLWAAGMSLVGIVVLMSIPLFLGVIARASWLAPVAGCLLLLLYIPIVASSGRILFSAIVCYPFSVCAISTERKADAFEGFSRSNAYLFQRPIVVAILSAALIAVGWVGYQMLFWIMAGGWYVTRDCFLLGAGIGTEQLADYSQSARAASVVTWIIYGTWLTSLFLVAYKFSFFWSATAAVYLIVRRCVDNTELDDIDSQEPGNEIPLPPVPPPPQTSSAPQNEVSQQSHTDS